MKITMERIADKASDGSRAVRVAMYADWLEHDADGLAFNVQSIGGHPIEGATVILAAAKARLLRAIETIDSAIERDRAHHAELEVA